MASSMVSPCSVLHALKLTTRTGLPPQAYSRVSDVGLAAHIACFVAFMTCVEFGVYWAHRLLHDIRQGYR